MADDLRSFPGSLRLVAELIDGDAALRLAAHCGGIRLSIPANPERSRARIVQVLGADGVRRLLARLSPGDPIDVPVMAGWLSEIRRRRILQMRAERRTVAEIARALGMTERGVYKALARRAAAIDDRQLDMFRPAS